jgi:hypothetical protein
VSQRPPVVQSIDSRIMGPPLNNMFKYFTGSRLLTAPSGNAGPYAQGASSSNGAGPSSSAIARVDKGKRPFVVPNLTVLAEVSANQEVTVRDGGGEGSGGKIRKSRQEGKKCWKSQWSGDFPWAEPQPDENGNVSSVNCAICSEIRGRPVLIKNKRDNLMKHAGYRRARSRFQLGDRVVEVGQIYSTPDCEHGKNDAKWLAKRLAARHTPVVRAPPPPTREMSKKQMQFVLIFDMLLRGRPMTDYPLMFNTLDFLRVELPKMHWCESSGWEIADSLKAIVDQKLREEVFESTYFSISCDEVTSIANEVWISVHIYLVKGFSRQQILLCCKRVAEGCNSENVTRIVTESLMR